MKLYVQMKKRSFLLMLGTLLLLLLAACSTGSTSSTSAGDGTSSNGAFYGKNVIVNGDAESGKNDQNGDKPVSSIPGWTLKGDIDVVPYGSSVGVPKATDPGPSNRGKNMFTGGPDTASTSASQNIDISTISADVAGGNVSYTLSGYLGGFSSQTDNAVLSVQFEDNAGKVLASAQIGPVTASDRNDASGLLQRTTTGKVPVGTVKVTAVLRMTRDDGEYNDGYADNLSVVFQKA
jgi:hypothetical protein